MPTTTIHSLIGGRTTPELVLWAVVFIVILAGIGAALWFEQKRFRALGKGPSWLRLRLLSLPILAITALLVWLPAKTQTVPLAHKVLPMQRFHLGDSDESKRLPALRNFPYPGGETGLTSWWFCLGMSCSSAGRTRWASSSTVRSPPPQPGENFDNDCVMAGYRRLAWQEEGPIAGVLLTFAGKPPGRMWQHEIHQSNTAERPVD